MIKSSQINREKIDWLLNQPMETKAKVFAQHFEICRILANSLMDQEVNEMCGERYQHSKPNGGRYSRYGFNPGSVKVGSEKLPVAVPRVYDNKEGHHVGLDSYEKLKGLPEQDEKLVKAVLYGLSTRDYEGVLGKMVDGFGLSSSTVSKNFIEQSRKALLEFENRKFDKDFVALFLDGKSLAGAQMIIALGVTINGEKVPLGAIQTSSENARSVAGLLKDLVNRGLEFEKGLLVVIDGSKGIRKAVDEVFGIHAQVQRCQWHKRENVISYLPKTLQIQYRKKLQRAYNLEQHNQAHEKLMEIHRELLNLNRTAANSLLEGMEETLTIKRLGLNFYFHRSFATTNCIENLNSQLSKYLRKIKRWTHSDQRYRWIAISLIEVEKKLRKVRIHKMLSKMRQVLLKETQSKNRISNAA